MTKAVTDSLTSYWPDAASALGSGNTNVAAPTVQATNGEDVTCSGGSDGGVLVDSITYCPSTNTISYDPTELQQAHDNIGDFAGGTLLAEEWSSAIQHQLGKSVGTEAARKTAECLTGSWVASIAGTSASGASSLSPGDLDEAVTVLLSSNQGAQDRGTGFDRVAAFRSGFKQGAASCVSAS